MHDQPVAAIRQPLDAEPRAWVVVDIDRAKGMGLGLSVELK
jgi:hypothetical protein